jgi:hypothetical protein
MLTSIGDDEFFAVITDLQNIEYSNSALARLLKATSNPVTLKAML